LQQLGFDVDLQAMDFGTLLARRNSKAPSDKGGWSLFCTSSAALTLINPAVNYNTRGPAEGGWAGWYISPEAERITDDWLAATTPAARQAAFDAAQRLAMDDVPFVPLGFWRPKSAFRKDISGVIPCDFSLLWNVKRG
jgi:peptide/nickel transport system substrate-binding protein